MPTAGMISPLKHPIAWLICVLLAATLLLASSGRGVIWSGALHAPVPTVRLAAANVLQWIADPQAVEPLLVALEDQDADVREAVESALKGIGALAVSVSLEDQDPDIRRASVSVLGKIGDAEVVEPLSAALEDQNAGVRRAAVSALGKIGDAEVVEPLSAALEDQNDGSGANRANDRRIGFAVRYAPPTSARW